MRKAYPSLPSALPLTSTQLDGVDDFRKLYITARTARMLWQQLLPASWAGLHNCILTTFKASVAQPQP